MIDLDVYEDINNVPGPVAGPWHMIVLGIQYRLRVRSINAILQIMIHACYQCSAPSVQLTTEALKFLKFEI